MTNIDLTHLRDESQIQPALKSGCLLDFRGLPPVISWIGARDWINTLNPEFFPESPRFLWELHNVRAASPAYSINPSGGR